MNDEQNPEATQPGSVEVANPDVKVVHVDKVHAVLKDLEDGIETVKELPEHVVAWLRVKVQEIKSHL